MTSRLVIIECAGLCSGSYFCDGYKLCADSLKIQELLPIILCLSLQHPDAKERDNLLHLLFNLVRRPDYNQRRVLSSNYIIELSMQIYEDL